MIIVRTHESVFVDNIKAHRVADIEHSRRSRIVRTANGVDTDFLELLQPINPKLVRDARASTGMVEVQIHPAQLVGPAVDEESFNGIKFNLSQSDTRFQSVERPTVVGDEF